MHNLETWYIVDEDGNFGVGTSLDGAKENYESEIGELPPCTAVFSVMLRVPGPKTVVATAELPAGATGKLEIVVH